MIHDPQLVERLSAFPTEAFGGEVFQATRQGLNGLSPSTSGGRWMPADRISVLYTSLEREGALAEIAFHWSRLVPMPSNPVAVHRIGVTTGNTLRLIRTDLDALGVAAGDCASLSYRRTQDIGAAVAFLEHDGLIVPSARWACENLVLFTENHNLEHELRLLETQSVPWQAWAAEHGLLPAKI